MVVGFKSFASEYGLYCQDRYLKELGEFFLMVTASVMTIFLSIVQDYFGRKRLVVYSFALALGGFLLSYFGASFSVRLLGLMLLWSYLEVLMIFVIIL